jgi:Mrp family chromosome partitioning ATPase
MVVEANRTRARQASVALKRLESAHANILGVVLTKFNSKRAHYGYGYEYGYGYGADHDRTGDAVA